MIMNYFYNHNVTLEDLVELNKSGYEFVIDNGMIVDVIKPEGGAQ